MKSSRKTNPGDRGIWIPITASRLDAVERGKFAVAMEIDIGLRWLGAGGIALNINDQILAIDPFFTRIPFWRRWFGHADPNLTLAEKRLPRCDFILVSHAHYNPMLDVPGIACKTGAIVYGSTNTCKIMALYDVPDVQAHEISAGDTISFSMLEVEVLPAGHVPAAESASGPLPSRLTPPLGLREYRMDSCFNFLIEAGGLRLLYCGGDPEPPVQADVLISRMLGDKKYDKALLDAVRPSVLIPIYDDDGSSTPTPADMADLKRMVQRTLPSLHLLLPEVSREYTFALDRSGDSGRMLHVE